MTDKARPVFLPAHGCGERESEKIHRGVLLRNCYGDFSPVLDAVLYLQHETNGPTMHNHIASLRLYAFSRTHWQRFAPRSCEPVMARVAEAVTAEAALVASAATTDGVGEGADGIELDHGDAGHVGVRSKCQQNLINIMRHNPGATASKALFP
jgi:hypothetical protein